MIVDQFGGKASGTTTQRLWAAKKLALTQPSRCGGGIVRRRRRRRLCGDGGGDNGNGRAVAAVAMVLADRITAAAL
jgi:hypothetical protein